MILTHRLFFGFDLLEGRFFKCWGLRARAALWFFLNIISSIDTWGTWGFFHFFGGKMWWNAGGFLLLKFKQRFLPCSSLERRFPLLKWRILRKILRDRRLPSRRTKWRRNCVDWPSLFISIIWIHTKDAVSTFEGSPDFSWLSQHRHLPSVKIRLILDNLSLTEYNSVRRTLAVFLSVVSCRWRSMILSFKIDNCSDELL